MKKRILIIVLVFLLTLPSLCFASSLSSTIQEKSELLPSMSNYYFAKLMSDTYVSLLKEKTNGNSNATKKETASFQEARFKYEIAKAKFKVLYSILNLIDDEKHKPSPKDIVEIDNLGRDALFAYNEFSIAAQRTLCELSPNNPNYILTPSPITGNISIKTLTKLTFLDTVTLINSGGSAASAVIKAAATGAIDVEDARTAFNNIFTTYSDLKSNKFNKLSKWFADCQWSEWDNAGNSNS